MTTPRLVLAVTALVCLTAVLITTLVLRDSESPARPTPVSIVEGPGSIEDLWCNDQLERRGVCSDED